MMRDDLEGTLGFVISSIPCSSPMLAKQSLQNARTQTFESWRYLCSAGIPVTIDRCMGYARIPAARKFTSCAVVC